MVTTLSLIALFVKLVHHTKKNSHLFSEHLRSWSLFPPVNSDLKDCTALCSYYTHTHIFLQTCVGEGDSVIQLIALKMWGNMIHWPDPRSLPLGKSCNRKCQIAWWNLWIQIRDLGMIYICFSQALRHQSDYFLKMIKPMSMLSWESSASQTLSPANTHHKTSGSRGRSNTSWWTPWSRMRANC